MAWFHLFFVSFLSFGSLWQSCDGANDVESPGGSAFDEKMLQYRSRIAQKYFREISMMDGIIRLQNGVYVEILKTGVAMNAKSPRKKDRCKVSFLVKTKDGDILEESKMVLRPREVPIHAWGDIYTMMSEGDRWRVYVPPELAYGAEGQPERKIPPHAPIVVELEVFLVMDAGKSREEARKAFLEAQQPSIVPEDNNRGSSNNNGKDL